MMVFLHTFLKNLRQVRHKHAIGNRRGNQVKWRSARIKSLYPRVPLLRRGKKTRCTSPFKFRCQLEDLKVEIIHAKIWVTLWFSNEILTTRTAACTITKENNTIGNRERKLCRLRTLRTLTLSPGVELKSPATINDGVHSNLSDTNFLNRAKRDSRYLACASLTSAHSGSLKHKYQWKPCLISQYAQKKGSTKLVGNK